MAQQDALSIAQALAQCGVEDVASVATARAHLDTLKLTNPKRDRVSLDKVPRILAALDATFVRHCPNPACVATAAKDGRTMLTVRKDACTICGGSNTRRAVEELKTVCAQAGIQKVCLVGGSPAVREELQRMLGDALKLTLVEGTGSPSLTSARTHVRNHDVTILLGASELDHRLSGTYLAHKEDGALITVPKRGVEAIADALAFHARQRLKKG